MTEEQQRSRVKNAKLLLKIYHKKPLTIIGTGAETFFIMNQTVMVCCNAAETEKRPQDSIAKIIRQIEEG